MSSTRKKRLKKNPKSEVRNPQQSRNPNFQINSFPNLLIFIGLCFLTAGIVIPLLTFSPVIKEEINYKLITSRENPQKKAQIRPMDTDFGIIIPKIAANAKVIPNVNPYQEEIYQKALTRGVAHAEGSSYPGEIGNVFLFAHSSGDWYQANRYNSIFYLLDKMEKGDEINIYYKKQKYTYKISERKIVEASAIDYLVRKGAKRTVTLMTCWPPGTTLKRLIIIGEQQ